MTTIDLRRTTDRSTASVVPAFNGAQRSSDLPLPLHCQRCTREFEPGCLEQINTRLCEACTGTLQLAAGRSADPRARINTMIDAPHPFTAADRALIKRLHGYLPAAQLLELLNQRLMADLGDQASAHTLAQLHAEIAAQAATATPGRNGLADGAGGGWSGIRKILADARRTGMLAQVNESVINDFAVVFSLNAKQVLQLKDVLLRSETSR